MLTNRTIIVAFAAHPVVLGTPDPTPLRPLRLPKHVRYRCATPRRFVLTKRTCFPSVAQKPSLAYTAPMRPSGPGSRGPRASRHRTRRRPLDRATFGRCHDEGSARSRHTLGPSSRLLRRTPRSRSRNARSGVGEGAVSCCSATPSWRVLNPPPRVLPRRPSTSAHVHGYRASRCLSTVALSFATTGDCVGPVAEWS